MNISGGLEHFIRCSLCTASPFVVSAAALITSLLKVIQWQRLDPNSLWGTAPLPNPPDSGLRPPHSLLPLLRVPCDLWCISSSSTSSLLWGAKLEALCENDPPKSIHGVTCGGWTRRAE